jgi:hypothetical protein
MEVSDLTVAPNLCDLYCPVCGSLICLALGKEHAHCKHVLFLFIDGVGYVDAAPECQQAVSDYEEMAEKGEKREDVDDPIDYVLDRLDANKQSSTLCFSATSEGLAGEPGACTAWVAIDFGQEPDRPVESHL